MEALFMRAFEIRDAAEAQMRQQVASHSHTLVRSLLAAGHLPPPWLLPHPAALAKPDPRGAVEAQMRQQLDSYSQFLAGTLLAVGHRPPAWLQHPADVDTHGNTVTNDLASPRNVDHLHNLLTEINHQAEQKTLEVGVKPDIMNIATSAHRCQKCASETVTDSTGMHSSNENLSPANSLEVPYSGVSLLLQNETLHPVQVGFCEVSQPIAILLPEMETTCAAESEPLEGPRSSTTPLLETAGNAVRKVSADIANQKCENHLHHVLPEVNHWEKTPEAVNVKRVIMNITSSAESNQCQKCTRETVIDSMGSDDPSANSVEVPHPALSSPANSLEVPHSDVSLLLQNETPHPVQAGFCEVPQPITILLPEKETTCASESEHLEGPGSSTTPLLETAGNAVRKVSADIANQKCKNHLHHVLTEVNHCEKTPEAVNVKRVIMNITSSAEANQCQKCTRGTVIESMGSEDPSANSVEVPYSALSSLLQNDTLHPFDADFDEAPHPITITSPQIETTHTAETEPVEDPRSIATPLLKIDSLHSGKLNFLEGLDSLAATNPENGSVDTSENDSLELSHSMVSILGEKGTLHSDKGNSLEGNNSIASLLLDKESILTDSLEGADRAVLEKDTLHCVHTNQHEEHYFISSVLLDNEITDATESESFEGPSSMASPLVENGPSNSTKSNFLEGPDCISSRLPENDAVDTAENVSIEVSQPTTSVQFKKGKLHSAVYIEVLHDTDCSITSLFLEKGSISAESLEGASPLVEKDMSHSAETVFLQGTYSIPRLLLDKEAGHTSETTSLEGPYCLVSPKIEKDPLNTIDHTGKLRKISSLLDRCDNESSRISEHRSSGYHVVPAPISESALHPYQLADNTEAHDVCAWNNMDMSARPEAQSTASCKSARALHTAERNIRMSADKRSTGLQHHGTGQRIGCFDNAMELNVDSCATVSDNQTRCSGSSKKFSLLRSETSDNQGTDAMASLLFEKEPTQTDSLEGPHFLASPLLEKATLHSVQTDFLEASYSMSCKCISPNSERSSNSSNQTSPLAYEVQAGVNYSPESSMANSSDAICCNSPIWQTSLCSGSSLNTKVTAIHQHSRSYSLANNLDTAFASLASCSDFQADGERHNLRQENSSIECPIGGVKTARAEDYCKFDETMQECQHFSIPVPCNSPAINNRASQAFCEATELINLSSSLSAKYKMKPLDGVYQSLPSRFKKLMNRSLSYSIDDTNLLDSSYDSKKFGVFGKYSLVYDGAFKMSDDHTYDSPNAYSLQEDSDVPLAHSAEKNNLENLSGRTGSSSDYLSSIPELACFRIDEDSTSLGENDQMKLSGSIGRNCSRQGLVTKKLLGYPTNIHERKGTSCVGLTAGKSYTRKPDRHVHIRVNQDIKNPKENRAPSIRKDGKVTQPLLDRLSNKTEISSSKSERNRSETISANGCRPRNIVSNMTSYIPLVKQKQRPPTSCVKRNVRVRALEAAEAAKRREEKKQTDREKRKAAVELELVRLKQEKEHRQKQVVQQNKKDADIITRKRQRENDGKKGNGRKKKCVEEAPKHQKQLLEIMHSTNAMTDACPNHTDGKDLVENLVRGVKNQLISDERMESVNMLTASKSNSPKAVFVDWKSEGSKLQVLGSLSDDVDKSYEMSPYEDSDEEDFDNLEHEREIRRTCKLIPSWAQKENLNKILLSNQALDPREVFARKCSFILSDVLTLVIPHGLFK